MNDERSSEEETDSDKHEGKTSREEELIAEYEQAKKQARKASLTVTVLLVLIAGANVLYIVLSGSSFFETRSNEIATRFLSYFAHVVDRHLPQARASFERSWPVVTDAFVREAELEAPQLRKKLASEVVELEEFLDSRRASVEKDLAAMAERGGSRVAAKFEETLGRELTKEEAAQITEAFRRVFLKSFIERGRSYYDRHAEVLNEIEENIQLLVASEPDLDRDVDVREAVGIFLEFAGVQLQVRSADTGGA